MRNALVGTRSVDRQWHRVWPAVIALALVACQPGPTPPPTQALDTGSTDLPTSARSSATTHRVRVGVLGSLGDAGHYIGLERGYFAAEGLELELVQFDSAAQMVAPLGAGQLEAGAGAISAGLFNAVGRGVGVKCVAESFGSAPGHGTVGFAVRAPLVDRIVNPADLKGSRVAIPARGIAPETELATLLRQGGLGMEDIELSTMPFGDMVTAMDTGAIDVAVTGEPFLTLIESRGIGRVWKRSDEIIPDHQIGCLLLSPHFVKDQPEVARGYVLAFIRGARAYNDAFMRNDPTARAEVVEIQVKHTAVKDRALYDQIVVPGIHPDGRVNFESLRIDQAYFLASGQQQRAIDLDELVDMSFAEAAVRQLGPYRYEPGATHTGKRAVCTTARRRDRSPPPVQSRRVTTAAMRALTSESGEPTTSPGTSSRLSLTWRLVRGLV